MQLFTATFINCCTKCKRVI